MAPSTVYLGSWLEFKPGMDHGEDGEDRGCQATGTDKALPCGVNPQPVQWDEDITTVLQQVQQQRRVAVQDSHQQVELSAKPRQHDRQGNSSQSSRCGRGRQVVSWQGGAGVG